MTTEEIKLTQEERNQLEIDAKKRAQSSHHEKDIDLDYASIQYVIDQADALISKNPHLNYNTIKFAVCSYTDGEDAITLDYSGIVPWEPIYERLYKNKLLRKQRDYASYKKLQEQFGDK